MLCRARTKILAGSCSGFITNQRVAESKNVTNTISSVNTALFSLVSEPIILANIIDTMTRKTTGYHKLNCGERKKPTQLPSAIGTIINPKIFRFVNELIIELKHHGSE